MQTITKKGPLTAMIAVAMLVGAAGGSVLHITQTDAQSADANLAVATTPTQTNQKQPKQGGQFDPSKGGHVGVNGKREELLTGDTAEKVKAAALKAVPGGTIERVETDADGAVYEAHMTKSDGSRVTVLFDANFNVSGTETGMGPKNR